MAEGNFVETLLDNGYQLQEKREALFSEIGNNRELLRRLKTEKGVVSPEQVKEIDELYPPVKRPRKNGEATKSTTSK